jgi:AraC-like DNA-binding protein
MSTSPAPRGHPEAIVRPKAGAQAFDVERIPADPAVAEFVDYFWLVRWHVQEPYRQQVVPQPRVHVVAQDGRIMVHGVSREPFFRTLRGDGHALGAAFYAGGFRLLLQRSVGSISGTVHPAQDVLGVDDRAAATRILAEQDSAPMVRTFVDFLLTTAARPDPTAREVTALVAEAERRADIIRAEQLARDAGMSLRSLQRLFTEYVGVGPKWVIQRFRILDAAAAAHAGGSTDWAALAAELGFSDQAHLTRAFTRVVGTPPATYARDPATS